MTAPVSRRVDLVAAYAWRLIVIGAATLGLVWFLGQAAATGTALFGIIGAFVSVPLVAVVYGLIDESRESSSSPDDGGDS